MPNTSANHPKPRKSNKNTFNKSLEYYSILDEQSIQQSKSPQLSSLTSAQAAPTEYTMELIKWLLDYVATNPET